MKVTITKKDVAKRTAKIVEEKIYLTEKIVDGVFTALREFMEEADPEIRIEIRDFGVFEVKTTKPKPKARNPKTGEIIYVPARRKTHFKAGKLLKEVLKNPWQNNQFLYVRKIARTRPPFGLGLWKSTRRNSTF